jgi:starch-binding outer membrane protein SusE/F
MKNVFKILSLTFVLGALIFTTSCGKDEGGIIIDPGTGNGGFQVADGLYLAGVSGTDTTIVNANILNSAMIEGDGFAPTPRDGHFAGFMHLTAGSYFFAEIDEQAIVSVEGGVSSYVDSVGTAAEAYTYVELAANGAAVSISEAGLYHVIYDNTERNSYIIKVNSWGVIGGAVYKSVCVSDGFNADVDLAEVTADDGSKYESSGIILRGGEYKFRYNNTWTIGSYKSFTNFGGTLAALSPGASNITNAVPGLYTISFAMSADGTPSAAIAKTGDADECTFDPANYTWGIIGAATQPDGWGSDKKFTYANGDGGVHSWRAVFPLAGGTTDNQFKFRTDDTWATKLIPTNSTFTDNTEAGTITNDGETNGDGQWFVADGKSGLYYLTISTPDQGTTWNISIDEAVFEVIGAATPGGWDTGTVMTYADDLASATVTGITMTADEYKFRVNGAWEYSLGGDLTALVFNGANLTTTAGTFGITITTADGGVSYTATKTAIQ